MHAHAILRSTKLWSLTPVNRECFRELMSRNEWERLPEDFDYAISLDQTLPSLKGMRTFVDTLVIACLLVILVCTSSSTGGPP